MTIMHKTFDVPNFLIDWFGVLNCFYLYTFLFVIASAIIIRMLFGFVFFNYEMTKKRSLIGAVCCLICLSTFSFVCTIISGHVFGLLMTQVMYNAL